MGIILIAVVLNLVLTNANENALSKDQQESTTSGKTSMETIYVQALLGESEQLMDTLSEKEYDSLSEDQQILLNQLWLEQGKYQPLLERDNQAVEPYYRVSNESK